MVVLLLGQAIAFYATIEDPGGQPLTDTVKQGGIFVSLFHHAGITMRIPEINIPVEDAPFPGALSLSMTFALALMLGTALAALLLYRGGRAIALEAGGVRWQRAVHGAKVAVPYALAAFGLSFLVRFQVPLPPVPFFEQGQPIELFPAPLPSLLWPLFLGALAGGLGGAATAEPGTDRDRKIAGIVSGGWRMTVLALGFAFIGYLIRVALAPDVPLPFSAPFFEAVVDEGLIGGGFLLFMTLLAVPNIATLVLVPAMGGALGFFGGGISCSVVSYTRFPAGAIEGDPTGLGFADPCALLPIRFEMAHPAYFLFLLVPLAATIIGGRRAARRSEAVTAAEGAGAGALAGVAYALFVVLLGVLASVSMHASGIAGGIVGAERLMVGVQLLLAGAVALAWGAAGGALGGATGARPVPLSEEEAAPQGDLWGPRADAPQADHPAPQEPESAPAAPPPPPAPREEPVPAPAEPPPVAAPAPAGEEAPRSRRAKKSRREKKPKAEKPPREKKEKKPRREKKQRKPKAEKPPKQPRRGKRGQKITGFEPDAPLPPPRREPGSE